VTVTATDGAALDRLASAPGVDGYQRSGSAATIEVDTPSRVPMLVADLAAAGVAIEAVEPYRPSLEDLYFAVRRQYRLSSEGSDDDTNNGWRRRVADRSRRNP